MKKRILRLTAAFLIVAAFVPACDLIENCGTCYMVTEFQDGTTESTTPLIYCDENYTDKVNSTGLTIGGNTAYWVCE